MQIWELEAFALRPVCPLCFLSADEAMSLLSLSPSLLLSVSHLPALVQSYPSGTVSTLYVALLRYSITANLRRTLTCRSSTAPIRSFARCRKASGLAGLGQYKTTLQDFLSFSEFSTGPGLFLVISSKPFSCQVVRDKQETLWSEGLCGVFASFRVLNARSHLDSRRLGSPRGLLSLRSS